MPFNKNGIWIDPTAKDLDEFRRQLTEKEAVTTEITPNIVKALTTGLAESQTSEGNEALFSAISRLQGPVDVVIPVYAGLHVVKPCIDALRARTDWPYQLIVVDDASPDPVTKEYLTRLKDEGAKVLFNNNNRGFAATVNRGVAAGENPYVVVLNSDTLVTENWLTKMLIALESDPANMICNPATNNTAMINVNMYTGQNYLDMARAMDKLRGIKYPELMPTGFCFMFRRALWNVVGPFDEAYVSYGEESDFWFKTIRLVDEEGFMLNYKAVLADNAYVYHERGTSFSQLGAVNHKKQRDAGSARFKVLHPQFGEWVKGYKVDEAVGHLRNGIPPTAFKHTFKGNVAWVVKSAGPCGGMYFIADIINQMIEDGYNVKLCVINELQSEELPVVGNLHCQPIHFSSVDDFVATFESRCFSEGTLLAAVTELTPAVYRVHNRNPKIQIFNHVQSWDVDLANFIGKPELAAEFVESYKRVPNIVCSMWVADKVIEVEGEVAGVVRPGVNPLLFHSRYREKHDDRFTVGVLLLQNYPFKGFNRGAEYCKKLIEIARDSGKEIKVVGIGIDAMISVPGVTCIGSLSLSKMADVMGNEIDVFVDPADLHSYGLPALEALVSGCKAITFQNKGVYEYAMNWGDRIYIANDVDDAVEATMGFFEKKINRTVTREQVALHSRAEAVDKFIQAVFPPPVESKSVRIEVVTPHLRKHGGPTTNIALANNLIELGHNVTISMIHTDWNPEVFSMSKARVRTKWDKVPSDAKAVIINSDNPYAEKIMTENPGRKYIMYKLSHNARFKIEESNNLNLPWDHIITSTQWLKDACHTLLPEWEHKTWPDEKVTVVGWYHYGHPIFNCDPHNRNYGDTTSGFRVATLIHGHPLKGSENAVAAMTGVKKKYGNYFHPVGIGEVPKTKLPQFMQYILSPNRQDLAHVFRQVDIWFGASHTEGLGRLALEAMSSGTAVITTDTGAEFMKHEENCLLYPVGNPQAGAEAIDRLINDRKLMTKVVINGYSTAKLAASPEPFKAKVNKVILEVIDEKV